MKHFNLKDMTKGWFVGDFDPTIIKTQEFEVAVKKYNAGDEEKSHTHKVATELTLIVSGIAKMNGEILHANSIVKIDPNEYTNFQAVTDVTTVVVKTPSVKEDKYEADSASR